MAGGWQLCQRAAVEAGRGSRTPPGVPAVGFEVGLALGHCR
jgi:hypothetical protein